MTVDPSLFVFGAAVGALAGLLAGLLGIGGGIVIVPALILLFDARDLFPEHRLLISVATSLAAVTFTSLSAALAQLRAGRVLWSIVWPWGLFLVLGSAVAGSVAAGLPAVATRLLIGCFLGLVALMLFTRWQPAPQRRFPALPLAAPLGVGGGLLAGLAGIAGGNVIVPMLLYFNTPPHQATATSSALGVPIALAGTLGYVARGWSVTAMEDGLVGYVHYPTLLTLLVTAVACAPLGVWLAQRIPAQGLRRIFAAFLLLAAFRILMG